MIPWSEHLLNPRRLRGSDFLMRWAQGVWSERILTEAVNATNRYFALPYGPSGTAPHEDVRAFELYFERLEAAGLGKLKRPDLLVFDAQSHGAVDDLIVQLGGLAELPFIPEEDPRMQALLRAALIAVECENSLWRARMMPDFGTALRPQKRLGGRLGLKKAAVLPTIIIKDEDRRTLCDWQAARDVPLFIWHAFYDTAFAISLNEAERLIRDGAIEPTKQVYQAPGGATSEKVIYKIYYHYAEVLAETVDEPELIADSITDRNGHTLPYVRFEGGRSTLAASGLAALDAAKRR